MENAFGAKDVQERQGRNEDEEDDDGYGVEDDEAE
jgi:hypothetical protein